jgi:hypothetical protein
VKSERRREEERREKRKRRGEEKIEHIRALRMSPFSSPEHNRNVRYKARRTDQISLSH